MFKWILSILVFCNYALAEQVEIDLELLPQIEQERIKAAKLKHYYSELEEIKTRKEQCLSNKDVECVKHYEKLVIHLQQDLENTKSNLGQSDDWRYGLSIELLVKHFPIFANYQKQLKCDIVRVGDSLYFEKTNNNQELVAVAAVECRSRNRIAYCDLIESSDSVPFSRKLNDIDYDQLIELWKKSPEKVSFIKESDYLYNVEVTDAVVKFTLSNSPCDGPSHWMKFKLVNTGSETMQLIFQSKDVFTK